MRPLAPVLLTVALALSATPVAVAASGGRTPEPTTALRATPLPDVAEDTEDAARSALREIRAGDLESPNRDYTMKLRDLRLGLGSLDASERRMARAILSRPINGTGQGWGEPEYALGVTVKNDCTVAPTPGSHICVHWVESTSDAPVLTDADVDGLPDYVEAARDTFNNVWDRLITQGGYRTPLSDSQSSENGPDNKLDVYLLDLGADGLYGYCSSDDPDNHYQVSAYCAVDDDFSPGQFGGTATPLENLQVTAAHEFFHAVQFAYDIAEDNWLMEGTAAWIEDELYDDVNDNLQYLGKSPMVTSAAPLDYSAPDYHLYGSWIFFRYLSETYPGTGGSGLPVILRDIWQRSGGANVTDPGLYSTQAIKGALAARGTTLPKTYVRFGVANRRPKAFYSEGNLYPTAPLDFTGVINNAKARNVAGTPYHLTNATLRFTPGANLGAAKWKLRVAVDTPTTAWGYAAAVTVFPKAGKVTTTYLPLNAKGKATKVVGFSRSKIKRVEVTLTNASTRYSCYSGFVYSCQGRPLDDQRKIALTLKAFK